jgi:hypothetical protein
MELGAFLSLSISFGTTTAALLRILATLVRYDSLKAFFIVHLA